MDNTLLREKLNEVTQCLYEIDYENMPISLFQGIGGVSYFFFEKINSISATEKDKEFFIYLIELLVDKLNTEEYSFTYCDGLCGIAFILRKYHPLLTKYGYELDDLIEDIDSVLIHHLEKLSENDDMNTDFLHGTFGLLYYFSFFKINDHQFRVNYIKNINYIISYIDKAKSSIELNINYGLAHGLCSIMNVIKIYLAHFDPNCKISRECLDLCCTLFTDPRIDFKSSSLYPSISPINDFSINAEMHPVHLGWCYGDQTISTSLHNIAYFQNNEKLAQFSLKIADHWKKRDTIKKALNNDHFYDYMLCHGVGSVALYNKIWFNITQDEQFYKNYDFFMMDLLSQEQAEDNVAGYKRAVINQQYEKSYGILTGVAGVGLILLDAFNSERKSWYDLFII